ncbi:unnamed protein product [Polarella glacialis]|uniref:Calmodulin-lysine N-methyltransferase n=1 Tax=Polarella glacialis TaxID=89957 RepID=A0A813HLT9_POLGL|nr:unnamed protein product [Polarella glacialis]
MGKFGAIVTMTDCEPEVLTLLHQNALANGLGSSVSVQDLNWSDKNSFIKPAVPFDMVVAADVLYGQKDRWFMRALEAHMVQARSTVAFVACPPRSVQQLPRLDRLLRHFPASSVPLTLDSSFLSGGLAAERFLRGLAWPRPSPGAAGGKWAQKASIGRWRGALQL